MEDYTNYWLRRRLSRRTTLRGALAAGAGAGAFALVGCGDDDDDGGGGGEDTPTPSDGGGGGDASPTPPSGEPVAGGSFSFQIPIEPPSLDPYTQTSFLNAYMNGLSYSKLLRFRAGTPEYEPADLTMEPDLAETLPEQPDDMTWTFTLKPAKFHNGRDLTSEDVAYAFDRYANLETSRHRPTWSFLERVETPDDKTVTLITKYPYADVVQVVGGNLGAWISPKEHAETDAAASKMLGSGPFIHESLQSGVSLKFTKNPDYYDQPYPYFDDVTVFIVPDQAKRVADFLAGSVDLTWLFLPDERDQIRSERPNAQFEETQGIGGHIYMRTDMAPFNDPNVRRAISMGIDRQALRDAITKGEGEADQIVFVGFPFATKVADLESGKYFEYNPDEARKLLDAAIGQGETLQTTWDHADPSVYTQAYTDTATLSQAMLKQVGVDIQDNEIQYAQYISTIYQGQYQGMAHTPRAVPDHLDYLTDSLTFKDGVRGRVNLSYINDPELESLLDKQRGEFDSEARLAVIHDIEERVGDQQYYVYFSTDTRSYFWDEKIRNYRPTAFFPYTHVMKTWREA